MIDHGHCKIVADRDISVLIMVHWYPLAGCGEWLQRLMTQWGRFICTVQDQHNQAVSPGVRGDRGCTNVGHFVSSEVGHQKCWQPRLVIHQWATVEVVNPHPKLWSLQTSSGMTSQKLDMPNLRISGWWWLMVLHPKWDEDNHYEMNCMHRRQYRQCQWWFDAKVAGMLQ